MSDRNETEHDRMTGAASSPSASGSTPEKIERDEASAREEDLFPDYEQGNPSEQSDGDGESAEPGSDLPAAPEGSVADARRGTSRSVSSAFGIDPKHLYSPAESELGRAVESLD